MELVATTTRWELLRAASTGGASSACIEGSVIYSSPGQSSLTITDNMATYCTFTITVKGGGGGKAKYTGSISNLGGSGGGVTFSWLPSVSGTLNIYVGGAGISNSAGLGGGASGCSYSGSYFGGGGGGYILSNAAITNITSVPGGASEQDGSVIVTWSAR